MTVRRTSITASVLAKPGLPRYRARSYAGRPGISTALTALCVTATLACAQSPGGGDDDAGAAAAHRAVVLIVIDALRADHLGTYGYEARPTSPNIDRRAAQGRVFERAWATSSWTLPSFGSILTGHLPSAHAAGVEVDDGSEATFEVVAARRFVTLPDAVPTVAERMAAAGFATGAFVANPFLDPRFGLGRGFGYYDHYDTSNADARPAAEVVDLALQWIDDNGSRPFFLMVHLFDPHLDYGAPAPFGGRFVDPAGTDLELPVRGLWPIRNRIAEIDAVEREFIAAAYDEEVAYVDAEVERLLSGLQERDLYDDSLIALTSDHGEELFEHGGFEHGHSMYEEVLRVPFILWGPEVAAGRDRTPVSLIDLAPTMLAAAGAPIDDLPGRSLLGGGGVDTGRPVIAERLLYGEETKAMVSWPHKVILQVDSGNAMLFDLAADPGEQHDLAGDRPDDVAYLLGALAERLAAAQALGVGGEAQLDEDLLRRLRALGHIR